MKRLLQSMSVMMVVVFLSGMFFLPAQGVAGDKPTSVREYEAKRALDRNLNVSIRETNAILEHSYDQVYLNLDIVADTETESFAAVETLVVVTKESDFTELDFHLAESATLDSVHVNGELRSWSRTIDPVVGNDSQILVDLDGMSIGAEETLILSIWFTGAINPLDGAGMRYMEPSTLAAGVIYTMAEPYDARCWLAAYDLPGDKLDSTRISFTYSYDYNILSNGELESETLWKDGDDSLKTTVWMNREPISTYLISIAADDYLVYDAGVAGVNDTPIHFYIYPEWYYDDPIANDEYTAEKAIYDMGRTAQYIDMMEYFFFPYPFTKYDQAMVPMGGAMEHQTCTSFSESLVGDGLRHGEITLVHELAHQWWGDYVSPQTFADMWLNEGFATYSEALWSEYFNPSGLGTAMMPIMGAAKSYDDQVSFPVYDPPRWALFSTTVYEKGGSILHTLRWTIGDSAFFEGLKNYAQNRPYGVVTTQELQEELEATSGKDLTDFFDQWVYGNGYPVFNLRQTWVEQGDDDTWTMYVDVSQEQNRGGYFSVPLPITVKQGYSRILDSTLVAPIEAVYRDTLVLSGIEFEPDRIIFDRDHWVLCDFYGTALGIEEPASRSNPERFEVSHAWPNPFNASTNISMNLDRNSAVNVQVMNILGQRVATLADGRYSAGSHKLLWQPGSNLSSGIYLIRVDAEGEVAVRRVTLVR